MTVGVVVDTVSDKSVLDNLDKYSVVVLVKTPAKATKIFSKVKKLAGNCVLLVDLKYDSDTIDIEQLLVNIGRTFAGYKEPVEVWFDDKCVVY